MNYPEGYSAPQYAPHCGVLAVAIFAGVSFEAAWAALATSQKRPGAWKGRTNGVQRIMALRGFGVDAVTYLLSRRCTVATFAKRHAVPGRTYMLRVGGHVVTLRDGIVADQGGMAPAASHRCARKMVTHITVRRGEVPA